MTRPATASDMRSPIIGSGNPVGSATASAGGSQTMKACLRSATARASLTTPGSKMPGVSSRLKIGILSSALSASNASVKSPGEYVVNGVAGRFVSNGVGPSADDHAVGYAPPPGGATVTNDETNALTVPRRLSKVLLASAAGGVGLRVTRRNVSARLP